ncbi:MAG: hypothetical protein KDA92_09000 [Planctomycetales bacterium]|nr:hypothetical protein [Planctomycetales bacterium]MCA9168049.1 hypothetical protein [Planctomycetales bacterium]
MRNFSFALLAGMIALCEITNASADLIVDFVTLGPVALAPGIGTTTTSFAVRLSNPGGPSQEIASYSFFLDMGPLGAALPAGVTFDTPAATYISGAGVAPLIGAANPGTIELSPAAGDLGLGQLQFFNGTIDTDESYTLLSVNLVVDRATASPGLIDLSLNASGQNAIDRLSVSNEPIAVSFTVTPGFLELTAVPEPSAWMCMAVVAFGVSLFRLCHRKMAATMR